MKIVDMPIEIIVSTDKSGKMTPAKINIDLGRDESVACRIKVKSMQEIRENKESILAYDCEYENDGRRLPCELRFYRDRVLWRLHKI
jgi:hypothetical protein